MALATYTYLAATTTYVALSQTASSGVPFVLNATNTNKAVNTPEVDIGSFSRPLSLTSAGNVSGVLFTVVGRNNGQAVSATVTGPNANTVNTTQLFTAINSITPGAAVNTATSAGIGSSGAAYFKTDPYIAEFSVATQVTCGASNTYTVGYTLDDIDTNSSPQWNNHPTAALVAATTSQAGVMTIPSLAHRVSFASGSSSLSSVDFIQSGLV